MKLFQTKETQTGRLMNKTPKRLFRCHKTLRRIRNGFVNGGSATIKGGRRAIIIHFPRKSLRTRPPPNVPLQLPLSWVPFLPPLHLLLLLLLRVPLLPRLHLLLPLLRVLFLPPLHLVLLPLLRVLLFLPPLPPLSVLLRLLPFLNQTARCVRQRKERVPASHTRCARTP